MLRAQPDVQAEVLAVVNQHPLHRWWAAAVVGEADLVRVRVRVRGRVSVEWCARRGCAKREVGG